MLECLFCRIVAQEIPAQLVFEDAQAVAIRDIAPKAPTHVLIIPRKHIASLAAASDGDSALLGHVQRTAAKTAEKLGLTSYRLVSNVGPDAGQTVDHLHYHVLGGKPLAGFW